MRSKKVPTFLLLPSSLPLLTSCSSDGEEGRSCRLVFFSFLQEEDNRPNSRQLKRAVVVASEADAAVCKRRVRRERPVAAGGQEEDGWVKRHWSSLSAKERERERRPEDGE